MNTTTRHDAADAGPCAAWLEPADWPEWEAFVDGQAQRLIYHRAGWLRALEQAFPHMHGAILTLRDTETGRIVGGTTLCDVRSPLLGNRLVCVPFASFYDPLVRMPREFAILVAALHARAQAGRARRVEIRLWRTATPGPAPSSPYPFKHHWLDLTNDHDTLWAGLAATSIRQRIGRAQRAGIRIAQDRSPQALAAFHALLRSTRQRLRAPSLPLSFFTALGRELGHDRCRLFLAHKDDTCIGAFFALADGDTYIFEYAADLPEWRKEGVNQALYWHAIEDAQQLGCRVFSLGRTAADQENLLQYKRRWGAQEDDLGNYVDPPAAPAAIAPQPAKSRRLVGALLAHAPRPVYEGLSNAIYRHWG